MVKSPPWGAYIFSVGAAERRGREGRGFAAGAVVQRSPLGKYDVRRIIGESRDGRSVAVAPQSGAVVKAGDKVPPLGRYDVRPLGRYDVRRIIGESRDGGSVAVAPQSGAVVKARTSALVSITWPLRGRKRRPGTRCPPYSLALWR